jgi:hypothetical protein
MTERTYFANRAKLYMVNDPDGTPDTDAIAILKGVEITPRFEHQELYGMDSIIRQDVAKHTAKVEVKIKAAKFDNTMTTGLALMMKSILDGDPSGAATITDTNTVALFDIVAYVKGTGMDATKYLEITVSDVYFESFPFNLSENDFVVFDLSGVGTNLAIADDQTLP